MRREKGHSMELMLCLCGEGVIWADGGPTSTTVCAGDDEGQRAASEETSAGLGSGKEVSAVSTSTSSSNITFCIR